MKKSCVIRTAALLGLLGVALGAFGAHELKEMLAERQTASFWETAVFYQLVHLSAFILLLFFEKPPKAAYLLFVAGISCFSGSLYLLSFLHSPALAYPLKALVFVTPLGGLLLMAGWLVLIFSASRVTDSGR